MNNLKTVLFSPIGSTDPIAGQHDGALLHIIRKYRPDEVYVYLSKEICELEDKDHRYSYCLDMMKEQIDVDFKVHWIRRENLVDVHIFDFFLEEYRALLAEIYDDQVEVILNVSSGTPAMKSALQVLSSLFEKPMVPVQVSTPSREINEREDIKGDYDVELQWECNMDNDEDYEDRCSVSAVINQSNEIKKNIIRRHIEAYDYVAALRVAKPIEKYLKKEVILLLEAGAARLKLDSAVADKKSREAGYDLFPEKNGAKKAIFEFIMLLYLKLKKEEYADFLRAISPVYSRLLEEVIKQSGEINIDDFTYVDRWKNGTIIRKWNPEKIGKSDFFLELGISYDFKKVVITEDYVNIINALGIDSTVKKLVNDIRYVEREIRNTAAHSITYITDDVIKQNTGSDSKTIFGKIKNLAVATGIKLNNDRLRTYDQLNEQIAKEMG